MLGVGRVLGGGVGDTGKVLDVDQCRHQRGAVFQHQRDGVVGDAGAVLDAVDAGVDQARQRVFAEDVRGDAGAVGVRGVDGCLQDVIGPQRCKVADPTVDPVTDQLHPAVTPAGLLGDRGGQLRFVLDIDR